MVIVALILLGLCFGSFVNALVWRIHEQASLKDIKRPTKAQLHKLEKLSISKGRSMCVHCGHELQATDLIPVISWLSLCGKCRYCRKPIPDSPIVELALPLLFVASYMWWPSVIHGSQLVVFVLWLVMLVGLLALVVYDLRWMLLPDRLVFPLTAVAGLLAIVAALGSASPLKAVINTALAVAIGGGLFYVLYQLSGGKWIGGGDVKLGWLLGLLAATPARSFLLIFLAAVLGSLVSVPLLAVQRLRGNSQIPFGPFLIAAAILVVLFGNSITNWYTHLLLHI